MPLVLGVFGVSLRAETTRLICQLMKRVGVASRAYKIVRYAMVP